LARTDLYLQTKFTPVDGQDAQRIPYDPQSALPDQVAQSVAISLRNLRTEYLDCLVLHSPMPTAEQTRTVWRAFESLAAAGKIRQLGISNCYEIQTLERLYREARIKPAVLQNRFYADTRYDQELRAFCTRENIVYQSFWTLSANPHLLAHPAVAAMALRHRRSAPQILYRYLTQVAVVPLTGTTSRAHMLQDVAIFEFRLTDAECSAITAMLAT